MHLEERLLKQIIGNFGAARQMRQIAAHSRRACRVHVALDEPVQRGRPDISTLRRRELCGVLPDEIVHPVPARVWEFQKRLHVHEPRAGYGYLLESMP